MPGAIVAPVVGQVASGVAGSLFGGGQTGPTSAAGVDPQAAGFLRSQLDPSFLQGQPQDRALFQTLKNRAQQQQTQLSGQAANTLAAQGVVGGAAAQPLLQIQQQTQQGLADQMGNIEFQNLQRREAMQQAAANSLLGVAGQQAGFNQQLALQEGQNLGAIGANIGTKAAQGLFGQQQVDPVSGRVSTSGGVDFGGLAKGVGGFFGFK